MGAPTKYCKAAIVCDYVCGDTYQQIMDRYGCKSFYTIQRAVNASGIKKHGLDVDVVLELQGEGKTCAEIAAATGYDRSWVGKCLRNHGLTLNRKQPSGMKRKRKDSRWRYWCRKTGAEYDPSVSLVALIQRDGLICNMCGIQCDTTDTKWGCYGPTYPTLDHIVPLSKGGSHTWNNVQLLCGNCNCVIKKDDYGEPC